MHDYIACRTVPQLALMQQTLPPLSARKDHLQMLMYFMSALSVVFATVHADLYIAVSTAAISLCTGILEYQKLEVKVASLNRSIKELSKVLHDWDSCAFAYCSWPLAATAVCPRPPVDVVCSTGTFVERRKAWIKDQVVERTESAVMAVSPTPSFRLFGSGRKHKALVGGAGGGAVPLDGRRRG